MRTLDRMGLLLLVTASGAACALTASDESKSPATSADGGAGSDGATAMPDAAASADANGSSLATDPLNCGSTGHNCLGGACASGACQPVSVSPDGAFTQGPWPRGSDAYVAGSVGTKPTALWRFPAATAGATSLTSNAFSGYLNQHPLLLGQETYALFAGNTLFGNYDYSSSGSYQGILSIDLTSGSVTKLVDTPLGPMQRAAPFALDAMHLYWADANGLKRRPIGGGATQDLPTPAITSAVVAMASDASALYLAAEYDVFRYDKSDGSVTPVLQTLYRARHVAVDDKTIYATDVADTGCDDLDAPGSVWAAPKTSTSADATKKLVTGTHITSLTAGNNRAFWFDHCTGTVHSTTSAGADQIMWKGAPDNQGVVAKAPEVLYWRVHNKLWKLAD